MIIAWPATASRILKWQFPNGDTVPITVDAWLCMIQCMALDNSWDQLVCTDCHVDYRYPHEPLTVR